MRVVLKIIDFYLNQLITSEPSPYSKVILEKLVYYLRIYNYPLVELVDIISIQVMIDYILSSPILFKIHKEFIKDSISVIADILGDELYVKTEAKIIFLEYEFKNNICIEQKQINDKISEKINVFLK